MAAALAGAFSIVRASPASSAPASGTSVGSDHLEFGGLRPKLPISSSSGRMQVKTNAQVTPVINGDEFGLKTGSSKIEEKVSTSDSSTFSDESPDYSTILAGIASFVSEAEKERNLLDRRPKRSEKISSSCDVGKLIQNGLVFRQSFPIRSYEVGADQTSSIETVMNHLQETSLNHARVAGVLSDGFGATPEMSKRGLVWVVTKMQVLVEQYPTWGDFVEIDSWVSSAGKNGMRRDWDIRDARTGRTITRATSTWVMMNKHTRKLSKMADEVRAEIEPFFFEGDSIAEYDCRNLPKIDNETADHTREGLRPGWTDLDCNQHVNNVKYIRWVLESIPTSIMESHELVGLTMEYRRECRRDGIVRSLTNVTSVAGGRLECCHVLLLDNGAELVRGRTEWHPKLVLKPTISHGSTSEVIRGM